MFKSIKRFVFMAILKRALHKEVEAYVSNMTEAELHKYNNADEVSQLETYNKIRGRVYRKFGLNDMLM